MDLISYLTRIQFGAGAVSCLAEEPRLLRSQAPLMITERGVVAAGLADRVTAGLPGAVRDHSSATNPRPIQASDDALLFEQTT